MTRPDRRRLAIVLILGAFLLGIGACIFVERESYIQDAASEGLDYVREEIPN
jgi:hypothetical protein